MPSTAPPVDPDPVEVLDWERAGRILVTSLSGERASIRDICRDERTVLVFLRRFECATCTSYFILFSHLRPILRQANIRTVFITCHENLNEVQAFLRSFAFWLRSLGADPADGSDGSSAGILPGEIYLDVQRASYKFFGLKDNINPFQVIWHGIYIGLQPTWNHDNAIRRARFFLFNEMVSILPIHPAKSTASFQAPGILVVERGVVLYKHVVRQQEYAIPNASAALSEALSCSLEDIQGMKQAVSDGLDRFMRAVTTRETSASLPSNELRYMKKIGRGIESDVYLGRWRGLEVAVKRYKPEDGSGTPAGAAGSEGAGATSGGTSPESDGSAAFSSFAREAAMLMSLRHRNVVHLVGFGYDDGGGGGGPNARRPFLVSEMMHRGSLFHLLADVT
ncbi:hypothetical protein HK405_015049, partial [Cladochytrium tenue]